jgi:hypothetical protein
LSINYFGNRGYFSGGVPSPKMDRMIYYKSTLARDAIYLLDYSIKVKKLRECKEKFILNLGYKKSISYSPAFDILTQDDQTILIDCVPAEIFERQDNQSLFFAAANHCRFHEAEFQVMTEKEIYSGYRLKNILKLYRYAYEEIDPIIKSQIIGLITHQGSMICSAVLEQFSIHHNKKANMALMNMLYFHELEANIDDAPISESTDIFLSKSFVGKEK